MAAFVSPTGKPIYGERSGERPAGEILKRGLMRRCGHCGGRPIIKGYTLPERCPYCGYKFQRQDGLILGAMTMNLALTLFLWAVMFVIGAWLSYPDIAVVPLLVGGILIAVLVPILFYPFSMTFWASAELAMQPLEEKDLEAAQKYLAAQRGEAPAEAVAASDADAPTS